MVLHEVNSTGSCDGDGVKTIYYSFFLTCGTNNALICDCSCIQQIVIARVLGPMFLSCLSAYVTVRLPACKLDITTNVI